MTAAGVEDPDLALAISATFEIEEDDGRYEVEGTWHYRQRYLSERATRDRVMRFTEGLHEHIDRVTTRCRGKKQSGDRHGFEAPGRPDVFYVDTRVLTVVFPDDLSPGDEVSVEYRQKLDDIAYLPLYTVPNADRLEAFELAFEHPAEVTIDFATYFPRAPVSVEVARPDTEHTILRVPPQDGVEARPFLALNDAHAVILIRISTAGEPVTPDEPAAFAAWYDGQFDFARELANEVTVPIAADLDAAPDDLARLALIYGFVQKNFRYIADVSSDHSLVPLPPAEVLANRYGDCKDRVCLMQAIAARWGIPVRFVLVGSDPGVEFSGLVNFSQFNHVIGSYRSEAGEVFFDPTTRHVPFGRLPEGEVGRTALVLDGEASRVLRLPAPAGPLDDEPAFSLTITAATDSLATGTAAIVLRRWYMTGAASALARTQGLELQNYLKILVAGAFYKIGLDRFEVVTADEDSVVLRARADLSDFVVASPTRMYVPKMPILSVGTDIRDRADDTLPLMFNSRTDISLRIRLAVPGLTAAADSLVLGGESSARYAAALIPGDSGRVDFVYDFRREKKVLRGEDRDAYMSFATDLLERKKAMFILEKTGP